MTRSTVSLMIVLGSSGLTACGSTGPVRTWSIGSEGLVRKVKDPETGTVTLYKKSFTEGRGWYCRSPKDEKELLSALAEDDGQ